MVKTKGIPDSRSNKKLVYGDLEHPEGRLPYKSERPGTRYFGSEELKPGMKVYYDAYDSGVGFEGIVKKDNQGRIYVQSTGKSKKYWKLNQMSDTLAYDEMENMSFSNTPPKRIKVKYPTDYGDYLNNPKEYIKKKQQIKNMTYDDYRKKYLSD